MGIARAGPARRAGRLSDPWRLQSCDGDRTRHLAPRDDFPCPAGGRGVAGGCRARPLPARRRQERPARGGVLPARTPTARRVAVSRHALGAACEQQGLDDRGVPDQRARRPRHQGADRRGHARGAAECAPRARAAAAGRAAQGSADPRRLPPSPAQPRPHPLPAPLDERPGGRAGRDGPRPLDGLPRHLPRGVRLRPGDGGGAHRRRETGRAQRRLGDRLEPLRAGGGALPAHPGSAPQRAAAEAGDALLPPGVLAAGERCPRGGPAYGTPRPPDRRPKRGAEGRRRAGSGTRRPPHMGLGDARPGPPRARARRPLPARHRDRAAAQRRRSRARCGRLHRRRVEGGCGSARRTCLGRRHGGRGGGEARR